METTVPAAFPELTRPEAAELERCLLQAASFSGASGPVAAVERRALDSTWYRTEVVTVHLAAGAVVRCFVKDFGTYSRAKSRMDERRERELFFYRDLFPDGEAGLARYAGEVRAGDSRWLVLEHVDGVPLAWCELDAWHEAAAWLGRFQSAFEERRGPAPAPDLLKRHDDAYFDNILQRALREVQRYPRAVVAAVEAAEPAYRDAARVLMAGPQTLVHGAFRPSQVLVTGAAPRRLCPVDWEICGIGSCLYDLATLAAGFRGAEAEAFLRRFVSEARWLPGTLQPADLAAALATCRMHRTMKWIGHAHARGVPPDDVASLASSLTDPEEARA